MYYVVIALKISYWEPTFSSLQHTALFVVLHGGTNDVDWNHPRNITVWNLNVVKTFTKIYPKINTIITCMLPKDKIYSFCQTEIDDTNQILH